MARKKGLTFYKRRKKVSPVIIKEILSWIFGITASIFIALVLNYFLGMSIKVVGVSMEPTLYNSQQIFVDRFHYTLSQPDIGDVIIFHPNGNKNAHYYVKRIVAVPGDTVFIKNGVLYVNGEQSDQVSSKIIEPGIAANEFVLASGEYFCIGDNPNNSEDSRSANIGPVKDSEIIGKAWFRLTHENEKLGFVK